MGLVLGMPSPSVATYHASADAARTVMLYSRDFLVGRARVIERDRRYCKIDCPGCASHATRVVQVVPDAPDWSEGNLVACCEPCGHKADSEIARLQRPHRRMSTPMCYVSDVS